MDSPERQLAIADLIRREGRVHVRALSASLGCSEMTVRRDLEVLEASGLLRRVHGGAVRLVLGAEETPFEVRRLQRVEAKQAIAAATAALLADGETVVLDGGTTAVQIARAMRGRRLTVMPLAVQPMIELLGQDGIRMLVPGGELRPGEHAFIGSLAESAFEHLRFDTAIISSCGADPRNGVTDNQLSDAAVKRAAVAAARRVILAADATKLGIVAFGHVCDLSAVDIAITDSEASGQMIQEFTAAGVDVRIA